MKISLWLVKKLSVFFRALPYLQQDRQCKYGRSIKAISRNHCCRAKQ